MAKTDNLIDYLIDIADAIREKKGTTDPINAQDFADEIRNVPTEGSGSGDNVKCFAIGMDNIVASDFAPENLQTIFQYEEGMTFADWLVSDYNTTFEPDSGDGYLSFIGGASAILMDNGFTREVRYSEVIQSTVYMLYGDY